MYYPYLSCHSQTCPPLVALAGERRVYGGNGWIADPLDAAGKQQALGKLE